MKITSVHATWVHVPIPYERQHVSDFGRVASFDSVVVKELRLRDDQIKAAGELVKRLEVKIDRYLNQLGNDDSDNLKNELLTFRKDALTTLDRLLTEEQRTSWKAAVG